jgi:hypothetical protein
VTYKCSARRAFSDLRGEQAFDNIEPEAFRWLSDGGVLLALPDTFQATGKARVIMDSFHDIGRWDVSRAAGAPHIQLWRGGCR